MTDQWRLPRATSDLLADWRAAHRAYSTATTDTQRAAVAERVHALIARDAHENGPLHQLDQVAREMNRIAQVWAEGIRAALAELAPIVTATWEQLTATAAASQGVRIEPSAARKPRSVLDVDHQLCDDPIARARARRGTGPALPPLDPRRR